MNSRPWGLRTILSLGIAAVVVLVSMAGVVGPCSGRLVRVRTSVPFRISALANPTTSQALVEMCVSPADPLWQQVTAMCERDGARCRFGIDSFASFAGNRNVIVEGDGFEIGVTGTWIIVIARTSMGGWTQRTGQLPPSAASEWESLACEVRQRGHPRPRYRGRDTDPCCAHRPNG